MEIDYKKQIKILIELQRVDSKLSELYKKKQEMPLELESFRAKVEEEKQKLQNIEETIKNIRLKIKEKELELHTAEEGVRKLQQQLLLVKTNKEYKSLLNEIGGKKADNSLIEDNILDFMENLDEAELNFNKEKGNLKVVEKELQEEEKRTEKEIEQVEVEIKKTKIEREEVAAQVNPQVLSIYSRLLKSKGGIAIVPVLDNACGGCHLSLRAQTVNEIKRANSLVTCERCSRILYLDE